MYFFKDEEHKRQTYAILQALKKESIESDLQYGVMAYVIGGTYKGNYILDCIDDLGLDVDKIYKKISKFSNSERSMIRFALQCYSNSIDDITLGEVMHSLDEKNIQVIKQAIDIRY